MLTIDHFKKWSMSADYQNPLWEFLLTTQSNGMIIDQCLGFQHCSAKVSQPCQALLSSSKLWWILLALLGVGKESVGGPQWSWGMLVSLTTHGPLVDNPISLPPDTLHCTLSPHSFWCCKIFWVTCPRLSRFPLFKRGFRSPMFVDQNHVSAGPISISCCCRSPGCRNHPPSRWDSTSTWFKQKTMWFNQWNWAIHGSRGADPPLTAPCIPYVD